MIMHVTKKKSSAFPPIFFKIQQTRNSNDNIQSFELSFEL